jgi:hypothetical protein
MTVTGGGSTYPVEQSKPSGLIIKQDNSQEANNNNNEVVVPKGKKDGAPYPTLTGIEGQLDESFKNFSGSLRDAKERASNLSYTSNLTP